MGHEVVEARQLHVAQRLARLTGGCLKLRVAGLQLLDAFDVGRELVGGLDDLRGPGVGFEQQRAVARLQLRRQQRQQLFAADGLDLPS